MVNESDLLKGMKEIPDPAAHLAARPPPAVAEAPAEPSLTRPTPVVAPLRVQPLPHQAPAKSAAQRASPAAADTAPAEAPPALELLRPARPPIQRDVQDVQIASPSGQPAPAPEPPDPLAGLGPQQIDRLARLVYARLRQRMVVDAERLGR